ncbi:Ulp1 protease family carboxy-terminal domain protein, partial [Trifolium medium]|nr:Ulp1 protease family carboxy-terminal domain protein [Trifolium medium]
QLEAKLKADLQEKLVAERADFQEKLAAERAGFEEKLATQHQLMQQTMMETLKSIGFSQTPSETKKVVEDCSPKVIEHGSVKGSCSVAAANIKEDSDSDTDSVQKLLCMVVKRKTYFP